MKDLLIAIILLVFLSACSITDESSVVTMKDSEEALDLLASTNAEQPKRGDVILFQTESGAQIIYAYIEKDSDISISENESILSIYFEEPDESKNTSLQVLELEMADNVDILHFYINGEETSFETVTAGQ